MPGFFTTSPGTSPTPAPRTEWKGIYFDGRTPRRNPVVVTLRGEGLQIVQEDGAAIWWPYGELTRATTYQSREPVVLQRNPAAHEGLLVDEQGFIDSLIFFAPATRKLFQSSVSRAVSRRPVIAVMAAALICLVAFIYLWAVPAAVTAAASRVPLSWEEQLGQAAVDALAPLDMRCEDPESLARLGQIVTRLRETVPGSPYRIHLTVVRSRIANAFAAPGGHIVVFGGLLEKTGSAEDLAGVLAHEMQHIEHRHALTGVLRELSLQTLISLVAGRSSGLSSALDAVAIVGSLRYQREAEAIADADGMRMLFDARIDPHGLPRALEQLNAGDSPLPAAVEYLSTHPLAGERIARLHRMANDLAHGMADDAADEMPTEVSGDASGEVPADVFDGMVGEAAHEMPDESAADSAILSPLPLLPDVDWAALSTFCSPTDPEDDAADDAAGDADDAEALAAPPA